METSLPLLSVVVPVFCEEEGLAEFYARTTTVIEAIEPGVDHELVFVDDGSTDGSLGVLHELAENDSRVRVVELSRNFGHQAAITSGIDHARGDAVVVIDADLQDPPEVIADMVGRWREGYRVVYGVRRARAGETRRKRFTAAAYYRLLRHLSDTPIPVDCGDFRLLDRRVVEALSGLREESRYLRGLVSWVGFSQCGIDYDRDERCAGYTKFTTARMLRLAVDGITSFSAKPLRMSIQLGLLTTLCSLALAAWVVGGKLLWPENSIPGYTTLMLVVLFLGGVQLLSLGVVGEYLARTYRESKRRPLYIVAERLNFEERPSQVLATHQPRSVAV